MTDKRRTQKTDAPDETGLFFIAGHSGFQAGLMEYTPCKYG